MSARRDEFDVLMTTLELAVPLHLFEQAGWDDARRLAAAAEAADTVASHGDDLQFRGKYCAQAFNALARGLAVLAAAPGGVTFRGRHWCTRPHSGCPRGESGDEQ
jgi:hypothetical protein